MKTNYHTHSTWCDGRDSPLAMALAAADLSFDVLGFSSHALLPRCRFDWALSSGKMTSYVAEIRSLAERFAPKMRILCGVEADYIRDEASPDRSVYAGYGLDYIIGSVHFVRAPDGVSVPVDASVDALRSGIRDHFAGSAEAFVREYFAQQREMLAFDFDIVGHLDLVRKFNARHPYFDENAAWYERELSLTADAVAASGKIVEVNTGAISRGWLDDAYPSAPLRAMLRERGVKFVLDSDAHGAEFLDTAFERFSDAEKYVMLP